MRVVIQRAKNAKCTVEGQITGQIDHGYCLFVGFNNEDTEEIIETVVRIAPAFGGINLEDIAAPRCFEIEERLDKMLDIPVFHDDQHGTAIVVLAGIINALKVVGKQKEDCKVVVNGALSLIHISEPTRH